MQLKWFIFRVSQCEAPLASVGKVGEHGSKLLRRRSCN